MQDRNIIVKQRNYILKKKSNETLFNLFYGEEKIPIYPYVGQLDEQPLEVTIAIQLFAKTGNFAQSLRVFKHKHV